MREKRRSSDRTVLYMCLSDGWGSTERRCIADASYLRHIRGSAFILCLETSLVDKESETEYIRRLYLQRALAGWSTKLNYYFQLQHILQKQQVDIVHTYNYVTILPLGMILKGMPHIPMVFTFNEILPWKKLSILERWYISRTDSIFT